ncbi:putrescine ABC transporter permease [Xanthomonas oryzae pv. oryzicola BLS256]|uniref:Putrescine ABC transporter permease n=1 Tax=Xanthomonas oryzae pv. oryzicola (strain BLS256) TaxID=383407 RepID=G7TBV7_XANOB|nr:putrescine ABC transporter permease [Xanthomonas oryzae pv. oryzicola BLS256]
MCVPRFGAAHKTIAHQEQRTKRLRSPPGGRGRCPESACTTRTLRF